MLICTICIGHHEIYLLLHLEVTFGRIDCIYLIHKATLFDNFDDTYVVNCFCFLIMFLFFFILICNLCYI